MGVFTDSSVVISPKYGIGNLISDGETVSITDEAGKSFKSNKNDEAFAGYEGNASWGADANTSLAFVKSYTAGDFTRLALNWTINTVDDHSVDQFLFDGASLLYNCSIGFEAHIDGSQISSAGELATWNADPKGQVKIFIYDGVAKSYVDGYVYKDNCSVGFELLYDGDVGVILNGGAFDGPVALTITGTGTTQYVGGGALGEPYSATLDYFELKHKTSAFTETFSNYATRIYSEWTPKEVFMLDLGITRATGTDFTYKGAGLIYVSDLLSADQNITSIINDSTGVITDAKCFGNILMDGDINIAEGGEQTDYLNNMDEIEQSYTEKTVDISGFTFIENKTTILEDAIVSLLDTDNQYTFYITTYKDSDTSAIPDRIYIIPSGSMSGSITSNVGDKVLLGVEGITINGAKHPDYKRVITRLDHNGTKYE